MLDDAPAGPALRRARRRSDDGDATRSEAATFCPRCGLEQPDDHRFCARCGRRLPAELLESRAPKVTRWFRSLPIRPTDPPDAVLRVTRYAEEIVMETDEGSVRVPSHHVRFSVWSGDSARCAISIPDDEAEELADFLLAHLVRSPDVDSATPS